MSLVQVYKSKFQNKLQVSSLNYRKTRTSPYIET